MLFWKKSNIKSKKNPFFFFFKNKIISFFFSTLLQKNEGKVSVGKLWCFCEYF